MTFRCLWLCCMPKILSAIYIVLNPYRKKTLKKTFLFLFSNPLSHVWDLLTDGAARIILFSTFFPCHLMPWPGFEPTSVSRVAWLPRYGFFVENISLLKYLSGFLVDLVGVSEAGFVSDHGYLKCWIEQL